jgi:hypothetical protein
MGSLQKNPSDAAEDHSQPDWNAKAGQGVEPHSDDAVDPSSLYEAMREDAKSRRDSYESKQMG